MKISASSLVFFVLVAGCFAQAPPQSSDEPLTQILPGILIPASLSKSVDAKKAKPGDKIELKVTMDLLSHGKVVIPRNSKIEGHVTSAKAHTKESPDSELGLTFDQILIKDGKDLPMHAAIQAIAPPVIINNGAPGSPAPIGTAPPGQQSQNVGTSEAPDTALNQTGQYAPMLASQPATAAGPGGLLTANSRGAIGMKEVLINSTKETNLITSSKQNVHLDGGMQFMLRTE